MCNQSYVSVHADEPVLKAASVAYNSRLAVYFYFMTSGRFAAYRPKLAAPEVLEVPLALPGPTATHVVREYSEIDDLAFELFDLKESEKVLVEDAIDYTLSDFLEGEKSRGREPTTCTAAEREGDPHMRAYCEYFIRVLRAGFGEDRPVSAVIFRSGAQDSMREPYRLVSFALGQSSADDVAFNDLGRGELFGALHRIWSTQKERRGLAHRRVMRLYEVADGQPTIFLMKPDQKRFWTRSMGLQDGDDVALDLFTWQRDSHGRDESTVH